jgi:hypothetical protein
MVPQTSTGLDPAACWRRGPGDRERIRNAITRANFVYFAIFIKPPGTCPHAPTFVNPSWMISALQPSQRLSERVIQVLWQVNALARHIVEELPSLMDSLEADPSVKVIVFASGVRVCCLFVCVYACRICLWRVCVCKYVCLRVFFSKSIGLTSRERVCVCLCVFQRYNPYLRCMCVFQRYYHYLWCLCVCVYVCIFHGFAICICVSV